MPDQTQDRLAEPDIEDEDGEEAVESQELTASEAQSALDAMLSSAPRPTPTEKYTISRIPITVTLRGVQEREIEQVGRRSERAPSKQERARGIVVAQRDTTLFNTLLCAMGMADPDMQNRQLLDKFGPRPEDVIRNWFLPGEIIQMADLIMDLSGYSDEAVVRAGK